MDIRIQLFVSSVLLLMLLAILLMIRKKELELKYALVWLIAFAGVLFATLFPGFIIILTYQLGIDSPINMLFFLGFCFSLAIIFGLTVAISRMSLRIKKLAQEIALLERDICSEGMESGVSNRDIE